MVSAVVIYSLCFMLVRKPFVGGKVMYVVIYLISIKLVVVVKNMIINMDLIIFKTISTDWHVLV